MPMKINYKTSAEFKRKVAGLMEGIKQMMPLAGEVVAEEIVLTTLQGIGAGDSTFAPYSPGYQRLIDSVGGKPGGVVDLRGIFVKENYKGKSRPFKFLSGKETKRGAAKLLKSEAPRQRRALARGSGRRAFVQVSIGGRTFSAMTKPTRNRMGAIDPQSEMSADLIHVIAKDDGFRLEYRPRVNDYMIRHNETRPWFSTDKAAVKAALSKFLATAFRALVRNFNS